MTEPEGHDTSKHHRFGREFLKVIAFKTAVRIGTWSESTFKSIASIPRRSFRTDMAAKRKAGSTTGKTEVSSNEDPNQSSEPRIRIEFRKNGARSLLLQSGDY